MKQRRFRQVDVFSEEPLRGNPLAVVIDADGLDDAALQRLAKWTNLSETTFLLPPTQPAADYRLRIFTPWGELPFAGHPTLGSCHVWLQAGGVPRTAGTVVQECGVGLVRIRREDRPQGARLAFAAPPLRRTGPLGPALLDRIVRALRVPPGAIAGHQWVDNGPGWVAVMLGSAAEVLALAPDAALLDGMKLGVVAPQPAGADTQFELRAFIGDKGTLTEDPVTGSLNASVAQWLIGAGLAPPAYVAAQGTALGRAGRVHVNRDAEGAVWIGGATVTVIDGTVAL